MYASQCAKNCKIDYIHGKASIDHNVGNCNLVLRINEYLEGKENNFDIEFIPFKKSYQRICKKTDSQYTKWIDGINNHNRPIPKGINPAPALIYFFGHSLDSTDGDILRKLLLAQHTCTEVYYYNQKAFEQETANLVKIIGQDELIRRVDESNQTIFFHQQKETSGDHK